MLMDEEIQRIKKNLPSTELKLFQSFLSIYHASQQQNKQLIEALEKIRNVEINFPQNTMEGVVQELVLIASFAIISVQGGTSNATSNNNA